MEQNNKLCYIAKGITVKIGFLNAALYDLKGKRYILSLLRMPKSYFRIDTLAPL